MQIYVPVVSCIDCNERELGTGVVNTMVVIVVTNLFWENLNCSVIYELSMYNDENTP